MPYQIMSQSFSTRKYQPVGLCLGLWVSVILVREGLLFVLVMLLGCEVLA